VGTQTIKRNEEFYEVLDDLETRKMFGEATFYFQNGAIESCRISERHTKKDLKERKNIKDVERLMLDKSRPKVLVSRKADG
jgi:hypothetical protein